MSESEFGTTIGDIHGGEIIRTPEGEIIFLSSAFNSLTVAQLLDITEAMLKFKEQK